MSTISVKNVSVSYDKGKNMALNNFNLEVKDGEFCVLLGPSGCGKTTVLHCIAGLISPDSGEIMIDDTVVSSVSKGIFVRPQERNIAMVFQTYALYPNMTVKGNLSFALETKGMSSSDIEKKVISIAEMLGIESLLDRKPAQLSGGQRQRVALGRALVRDPKVFLLDEPLGNLDAALRDQVRYELKKIQKTFGITTIYVTHDQSEAMTLADRIVLIKDGKVIQEGTPHDLYSKPDSLFVASFIGTPQINTLQASIKEKNNNYVIATEEMEIPVPGQDGEKIREIKNKEIIVGIRPSDFRVVNNADSTLIKGEVELVEPLGDAVLVHFKMGSIIMLAKLPELTEKDIGKEINLSVDFSRLHIFDKKTGERIEF